MKPPSGSRLYAALMAIALLGLPPVVHADPVFITVVTNGTPAPDGIGVFTPLLMSTGVLLNDAGQASFWDELEGEGVETTNSIGIFRGSSLGTLTQIVRGAQAAPDGTNSFDNNSFVLTDVPVLNNAGEVAFRGTLTGAGIGASNDTGIFRGDGTAGSLTEIVREGQFAPDGDGRFDDAGSFLSPVAFNNSGQVAFYGTLTGTADAIGIFRGDGTTLTQIAHQGQAFLDSTFSGFNAPAINNAGQVAFVAGAVQACPGLTTAGTNNFADISGPIVVSGTGPCTTNYVEINGATHQPARYYRIRLAP